MHSMYPEPRNYCKGSLNHNICEKYGYVMQIVTKSYYFFFILTYYIHNTCRCTCTKQNLLSFLDSLRKENERLKNDIASLTNKLNYTGSPGLATGSSQSYRSDTHSVGNIEKKIKGYSM